MTTSDAKSRSSPNKLLTCTIEWTFSINQRTIKSWDLTTKTPGYLSSKTHEKVGHSGLKYSRNSQYIGVSWSQIKWWECLWKFMSRLSHVLESSQFTPRFQTQTCNATGWHETRCRRTSGDCVTTIRDKKRCATVGQSRFFSFCWVHARPTTLDCAIDKGYSVRPSASLSVTLMIHAKTVQGIEICCTPYDRVMFLDHSRQILQSWV